MALRRSSAEIRRAWPAGLAVAAALICMAVPAWGAGTDCAAAHKTYAANCAMCHMANGTGNSILKSPNFTDPKWQAAHKDAELISAISDGVKGTSMPSWKDQLKPDEIDALVKCVVRGFGKKAAPSHPAPAKHPPA
jgi:mono/diheme cytochrome c family protein